MFKTLQNYYNVQVYSTPVKDKESAYTVDLIVKIIYNDVIR